jgi:hypothetical protein
MKNKKAVEAVDMPLNNISIVNCLSGGIPVVIRENWAQIVAVVPKGSCGNIVNACL